MNKKSFFAGIMTAIMIAALFGSVSTAYQKQATLDYVDIQLRLNGTEVQAIGATGEVVEPFIIDGTTYLPVRGIANLLNIDVSWDPTAKVIGLTTKTPIQDTVDMETLRYGWRCVQYASALDSLCSLANTYLLDGGNSATQIQKISDGFYKELLPVLNALQKDSSNSTTLALYMNVYNMTGTVEEVIYRYAQYENTPSQQLANEFYSYRETSIEQLHQIMSAFDNLIKE